MEAISYTAQWTAAARAIESDRPDRILFDPFAKVVAGEMGFTLLDRYAGAGTAAYVAIRTRYNDDAILATLADSPIRQIVFVAAGMDTRALRLELPEGSVVYELDRPALQEAKSVLLNEEAYPPVVERRFVPADLAGDWSPALLEAGFDPSAPVLWVVEGLMFFLTEDQVRNLLTEIRRLTPAGSVLIGDFVGRSTLHNPLAQGFLRTLSEAGTPWRFGTDEPEEFLRECGWEATDVRQPGDEGAAFGRWPYPVVDRSVPNAPRSFMFIARVPS